MTGVEPAVVRRLAREFAEAKAPVAYSRIGVCNNRFGTLAGFATDVLNLSLDRLGRPGGAMFPTAPIDLVAVSRMIGADGYGRFRSRVRGLPETIGDLPAACLSEEIETPGEGQVRALITYAGNPVLSVPNGRRLDAALNSLEFMVSVDLYVNETTRHANLILPPAWSLSEEHYDLFFALASLRNTVRRSPPVVAKRPGERHDWEILVALAERLGGGPTGMPMADKALRFAKRLGYRFSPRPTVAALLRSGAFGDGYRPWRKGLRLCDVDAAEHGIDLGPLASGAAHRVFHRDGRVRLAAEPFAAAFDELEGALHRAAPADELLLIGRRETRSNNSWMHNLPSLVSGRERCVLFLHPKDAEARRIGDGEEAILESRVHRGAVRVQLTPDVTPGVVSLPHGWGHAPAARWLRVAGRHAGVSINDWTDEADVEGVVGQSILNGVPVRLHAAGGSA